MNNIFINHYSLLLAALITVSSCSELAPADELGDTVDVTEQEVTSALIQSRSDLIKSIHAAHTFIHNPLILAGIAYAETQMAHCRAEYTQDACDGPTSSDCGNGPVTAGYWDGPCSIKEGGLGMWQFDEGTHTETLSRWSTTGYWNGRTHNILSLSGGASAAIDFVLRKAWDSDHTPSFSSPQAMYDWINSIRPVNGASSYETWLGFLANSYNGQIWGSAGWTTQKNTYRNATATLYTQLGGDSYWYPLQPPGQPSGLSPAGWVGVPSGWMIMSWNPVAATTSYEVSILRWSGSAWTYYYTHYPTTSYITVNLPSGTYYAWNVRARNTAGTGPQSIWAYFYKQ